MYEIVRHHPDNKKCEGRVVDGQSHEGLAKLRTEALNKYAEERGATHRYFYRLAH